MQTIIGFDLFFDTDRATMKRIIKYLNKNITHFRADGFGGAQFKLVNHAGHPDKQPQRSATIQFEEMEVPSTAELLQINHNVGMVLAQKFNATYTGSECYIPVRDESIDQILKDLDRDAQQHWG